MSELYGVCACVSTLKINAYIIFAEIIWPAEYLLSIILFAAVAAISIAVAIASYENSKHTHTHIHVNTT